MATRTLGTNLTTSLTSLIFGGANLASSIRTLNNSIKDDLNPRHPLWPGAISVKGLLYVPNRGVLQVLPGDYVAFDSTGWPILVSKNAIANGPWTHS